MAKNHKNQYGFSLLEILFALGALVSALVILTVGVSRSLQFQTKDEELLQAVFLINNRMVELQDEIESDIARGVFPEEKSADGPFDEPFHQYKWSYSIKKVEIPLGEQQPEEAAKQAGIIGQIMKDISRAVREIKLTIEWVDEDDKKEEFSLTTHIVNLK